MFLRILSFPILRYLFPLVSNKAKKRIDFELKNHTHIQSLKKAEVGIELSSEGELEQVIVVLNALIAAGKTVELIFCSPSVESQCLELQKKHPDHIRLYRYPILSFNPLSKLLNPLKWLTCEEIYLCRYDFFPELMKYAQKCRTSVLLSATMINFSSKNNLQKKYLTECYRQFNKVVCVSESDKKRFVQTIGLSPSQIAVFDFRIPRIYQRQDEKQTTYEKKLPAFKEILNFLEKLGPKQKMIMGSFWPQETKIFLQSKVSLAGKHIFILPHQLDPLNLKMIKDDLNDYELPAIVVSKEMNSFEIKKSIDEHFHKGAIWILDVKGILCEFYDEFSYAYIGGGFGESIHSVMEPFLAQNFIVVGPVHKRSAELQFIKDHHPDRIKSVNDYSEVLSALDETSIENLSDSSHNREQFLQTQNEILSWLLC